MGLDFSKFHQLSEVQASEIDVALSGAIKRIIQTRDVGVESKRLVELLDSFALNSSELVQANEPVPDASRPPDAAPALYVPRKSGKASEFLLAHYEPWLEAGVLFRPHLEMLDPTLKQALDNEYRGRSNMYADLLPKKSGHVDEELEVFLGRPVRPEERAKASADLSRAKWAARRLRR